VDLLQLIQVSRFDEVSDGIHARSFLPISGLGVSGIRRTFCAPWCGNLPASGYALNGPRVFSATFGGFSSSVAPASVAADASPEAGAVASRLVIDAADELSRATVAFTQGYEVGHDDPRRNALFDRLERRTKRVLRSWAPSSD
jgi:myo-inositol-1(or 4)-monophosphatase